MLISPDADWPALLLRARQTVPEAFGDNGRPLNLLNGEWREPGRPRIAISPVDGRELTELPMLGLAQAESAVRAARAQSAEWARVDLDERRTRVTACLTLLREHRDLISRLLIWEIGKPLKQAETDVDRCIDGVEWYVTEIERMMTGRRPLGVVSNIASWNYPYSVLMHSALVQALAGNAVVAKTPTDGGLLALTVGFALARRAELPMTLLSGAGDELGPALVGSDDVACVAFVGGRESGRSVAASLLDTRKRHMLEMEGVNAHGVWNFSNWEDLSGQIKKGYDYGKQRCTAYARFVVERRLFPRFLESYQTAVGTLKVGNPVVVAAAGDALPALDFGPLINRATADELREDVRAAIASGAIPLVEGRLDPSRFLSGQQMDAYVAPSALLNVPRSTSLHHKEPFGPVDTFVIVDSVDEMIAEMNVSNGALVSTIACDDSAVGAEIAEQLRSFKVGVNAIRSRGDREEAFGGMGLSWRGCFVGGRYLVDAVTSSDSNAPLHGNFSDHTLLPEQR